MRIGYATMPSGKAAASEEANPTRAFQRASAVHAAQDGCGWSVNAAGRQFCTLLVFTLKAMLG